MVLGIRPADIQRQNTTYMNRTSSSIFKVLYVAQKHTMTPVPSWNKGWDYFNPTCF